MNASKANSVIIILRHLRKNIEELDKKLGQLTVKAQIVCQVQRAEFGTIQIAIRNTMLASSSLWQNLMEPIWKASPSVMTRELREYESTPKLKVQDSTPVEANSNTACTRLSLDSGIPANVEKISFTSAALEVAEKASQPVFYFIKLHRQDTVAFNKIKAAT
ncbi:UNVERIFIED_CONTAM: hypothetical protein Sindi_0659000 [Sesamum indicum]